MIKRIYLMMIVFLLIMAGYSHATIKPTLSISHVAVLDLIGLEATTINKDSLIGFRIKCEYSGISEVLFFFDVIDPDGKIVFSQQGNSITADKGQGKGSAELNYIPIDFYTIPGEYIFKGTVKSDDSQVMDTEEVYFIILEALPPELISPGAPFKLGAIPTIFTPYPHFQFLVIPAGEYILLLYKTLPEQSIPEEIVQNEPVFTQKVCSSGQFTYPISAEPLEEGALYAWQVKLILQDGSKAKSKIFGFYYQKKISYEQIEIVQALSQLPEIEMLILNQLLEFYPTGKIFIDNQNVSIDELKALIDTIKTGKIKIKEVYVE